MLIDSSLAPFGQVLAELWRSKGSGLWGHFLGQASTVPLQPFPSPLLFLITFSSHLLLRCALAFRNRDDMSYSFLMSNLLWLLVSMGEGCLQRPRSIPSLSPLGCPHLSTTRLRHYSGVPFGPLVLRALIKERYA